MTVILSVEEVEVLKALLVAILWNNYQSEDSHLKVGKFELSDNAFEVLSEIHSRLFEVEQ